MFASPYHYNTMRHQPTPDVTLNDVERIVRRDFPVIQFESVMAVLKGYEESASGRRERSRVQLATLKLANDDLAALRKHNQHSRSRFQGCTRTSGIPRV